MNEPVITHENADELLPWYVNRSLSSSEHQAVKSHLQQCAECRENVDALEAIQGAVREDRTTPIIPAPNPSKLFDAMDRPTKSRTKTEEIVHWALAAGIAMIAVLLVWQLTARDNIELVNREFTTASDPVLDTLGDDFDTVFYTLEIALADEANEERLNQFLGEMGAVIDDSNRQGKSMQVTFETETTSLQALSNYAATLEASPDIDVVRPVSVQLSVE